MHRNRMIYFEHDASFTKIENLPYIDASAPPDNCPCCLKAGQRNQDSALTELGKGFAFRGFTYHIDDYVMIKTPSGPCDVGQIVELSSANSARGFNTVSVLMLGRISDIISCCPRHIVKDEVREHLNLLLYRPDLPFEASFFLHRLTARSIYRPSYSQVSRCP